MNDRGKVYLIPCPLYDGSLETIPPYVQDIIKRLRHFYVEDTKSARRYLKTVDKSINIDELILLPLNEHIVPDLLLMRKMLKEGVSVGIISEAGCPAVADPGNIVVQEAHRAGALVIPLVGPNAMLLALMASGMNGQYFQFVGYIPVKQPLRSQMIRQMELMAVNKNQTQIFMETPYRNNQLLQDVFSVCKPETYLCIAANITAPDQFIRTAAIGEWQKNPPDLHKKPAVFLIGNPNR